MKENKNKTIFLDGSTDEQKKAVENFLNSMTAEEHKRAMSSEFDYLEEE